MSVYSEVVWFSTIHVYGGISASSYGDVSVSSLVILFVPFTIESSEEKYEYSVVVSG